MSICKKSLKRSLLYAQMIKPYGDGRKLSIVPVFSCTPLKEMTDYESAFSEEFIVK
jgi:hypothetical protein